MIFNKSGGLKQHVNCHENAILDSFNSSHFSCTRAFKIKTIAITILKQSVKQTLQFSDRKLISDPIATQTNILMCVYIYNISVSPSTPSP